MKKKKTYPISTTIYRMDLSWIYKHYLDQEAWKKKWCLFDYDGLRVEFHLASIDIEDNIIHGRTDISYAGDKRRKIAPFVFDRYHYYGDMSIPLNNPEYTQECFEKKLNGNVYYQLKMVEDDVICHRREYKSLQDYLDSYDQKLEDIANDFLDEQNVTNDDIREAYIDWYKDKMKDQSGYDLDDIVRDYQYTILTKFYCLYASMVNDQKNFELYRSYYDKQTPKSHRLDYYKLVKRLEDEGYIEDLKGGLEPLQDK